jgi:hypothetical protein
MKVISTIKYFIGDRIGLRLFSIMLYNKYESPLLLITPVFLKSLNIVRLNQLVIFDFTQDYRDLIRTLAKFSKKSGEEESKNYCHIFIDSKEKEKYSNVLDKLNISE